MEDYPMETMQELREKEPRIQKKSRRNRGSAFITMLIILLFLAAGLFFFATRQEKRIGKAFNPSAILDQWKEEVATTFAPKDSDDIRATVDRALGKTP